MSLKPLLSPLFGLLLFLLPPTSLWAKDTLMSSKIKGQEDSFFLNISQAIADKLGLELQLRSATFGRALLLIRDGDSDIHVGALKRPEREAYLHYIEPPFARDVSRVFVVAKDQHSSIQRYEDLYGLRIGTQQGFTNFPRFDEDTRLKKQVVGSPKQNIGKLLRGRIDAFIIPKFFAIEILASKGLSDKLEFADYVHRMEDPGYIVLSKKSPLMATRGEEVESVIREMIESGEIRTLIEQHFISRDLPVPDFW
ncbi:MAG: amino acid ABC transporter substrate-binding protein [bacterium]|nr:amino acid ABC transporter substrate-binding protein [bacterium]